MWFHMGVSEIRGLGVLIIRDPTIWGSIVGAPIFRNSNMNMII